jgi:hypothetical protein
MTDFAVFDVSAGLGYLKPAHVADGFPSTCQRILYCILKSLRRGANDLNLFVNMIRHALIFPDDVIEHNKKPSFGQGRRVAPSYQRITNFALQTHHDFGSLAVWENRSPSLYHF